jgi:4-methyl-5(b-hydroxyethyl)-thiazole monophosphate biosynthesis
MMDVFMRKNVLLPIANGSEEMEAIIIADTISRSGAKVIIASVDNLEVTCSRGIKLVADALLKDCINDTFDLIVLPGGLEGSEKLRDSKELIEMLKTQLRENRLVGAICAAPFLVLHHHGLLKQVKATCYPYYIEQLDEGYRSTNIVEFDKNIATSQGPGTALQFALKLVELLFGKDKSQKLADSMIASY